MNKKIFLGAAVLALVLVVGGFFYYWWQNQTDVRELNKTLPEGVRVVKSLIGNEYRIVNKIDGYEFETPIQWAGFEKEIEYIPEREVSDFKVIGSLGFEGKAPIARPFSIDVYDISDQLDADLIVWAKTLWTTFSLNGELQRDIVQNVPVVKVFESEHLGNTYVYFMKQNTKIYVFNNKSEEDIRYIISNGKW